MVKNTVDIGGMHEMDYVLYAVGFFGVTILIQYLLHKLNKNKRKVKIWTGANPIIVMCTLGLIQTNISYLAAVIGFVLADEIGKTIGWN